MNSAHLCEEGGLEEREETNEPVMEHAFFGHAFFGSLRSISEEQHENEPEDIEKVDRLTGSVREPRLPQGDSVRRPPRPPPGSAIPEDILGRIFALVPEAAIGKGSLVCRSWLLCSKMESTVHSLLAKRHPLLATITWPRGYSNLLLELGHAHCSCCGRPHTVHPTQLTVAAEANHISKYLLQMRRLAQEVAPSPMRVVSRGGMLQGLPRGGNRGGNSAHRPLCPHEGEASVLAEMLLVPIDGMRDGSAATVLSLVHVKPASNHAPARWWWPVMQVQSIQLQYSSAVPGEAGWDMALVAAQPESIG